MCACVNDDVRVCCAVEHKSDVTLSLCSSDSSYASAAALKADITTDERDALLAIFKAKLETQGIDFTKYTIDAGTFNWVVTEGCPLATKGRRLAASPTYLVVFTFTMLSWSIPMASVSAVAVSGLAVA